jgi:hypothetical protein
MLKIIVPRSWCSSTHRTSYVGGILAAPAAKVERIVGRKTDTPCSQSQGVQDSGPLRRPGIGRNRSGLVTVLKFGFGRESLKFQSF